VAIRRLRAVVSGQVQMVGFRAFVHRQAIRLGLSGSVRNLPTGEVEVAAEGEEIDLRQLLEVLREGPRSARVTEVEVAWHEPAGERRGFRIGW
jgi:acylphosphatase